MFDDKNSKNLDKLRILLAVVLSVGVLFFWTFFYDTPEPTNKPVNFTEVTPPDSTGEVIKKDSFSTNISTNSSKKNNLKNNSLDLLENDFKEERIIIKGENLSVVISTLGGVVVESIISYNIINQEEKIKSENQEGLSYPGFETANIRFNKPNLGAATKIRYQVLEKNSDSLRLAGKVNYDGKEITVIKQFSLENYRLNLSIDFKGIERLDYYLLNGSGLSASAKKKKDFYNIVNLSHSFNDSLETPLSKGITSFFTSTPEIVWISPPFDWISIDDRFFARVLSPEQEIEQAFFMNKTVEEDNYSISGLSIEYRKQPQDFSFYYFPKSRNLLDRFYDENKKYFFNLFHQFKFMRVISSMMYWVIESINGVVVSYGLAIIIMTILLKLLVFPLQQKSMKSMQKMQEFAPKIKAIKDNYKKKPQKMNQELMAFYKKEGINPLGGCLPMLIPLPVFIALYSLFQSMVELKGIPFLWINDLSLPDLLFTLDFELPFFGSDLHILPVIVVFTSLLQSIFTPQASMTPENRQQMLLMKYMMPFFFFFISWNMPSALILYWTIQNVFTIGQTFLLKKSKKKKSLILNK